VRFLKNKHKCNFLVDSIKNLGKEAEKISNRLFNIKMLNKVIAEYKAKKIRRVIMTGCGDDYCAVGAMLPGFKKLSGLRDCNSPDIMDFCHYYSEQRMHKQYSMDEVLVIVLDINDNKGKSMEVLLKVNNYGAKTFLITKKFETNELLEADYTLNINTDVENTDWAAWNYYACMMAVIAVGAYIGVYREILTPKEFVEIGQSVTDYTKLFMKDIIHIDELMLQEAERMKGLTKFEVIADANESYSAQYVETKLIECSNVYCDHINSEEFAHISLFLRGPNEIGIIVLINEKDPSMSRMKDTIYGCLAQQRPMLIVTDAEDGDFLEKRIAKDIIIGGKLIMLKACEDEEQVFGKPTVCHIAKAPEQWMSPFVDFIPGFLFAKYHAFLMENDGHKE